MRESSSQASTTDVAVKTPVRRERVDRGIYRDPRSGRYEITYTDSGGRQRWQAVSGGLRDARQARAEIVSKLGRGERVAPTKTTLAELAEVWFEAKSVRLRRGTAEQYRSGLDLVILPRFGRRKVAAVDADSIAKLIRDLERERLHAIDPARPVRPLGRSTILNYLKPLHATLAFALRRGIIGTNPFAVLTDDDRPERADRGVAHEWTDEDLEALLAASARLAHRPTSRYDYTPLLRLVATLGLRKG